MKYFYSFLLILMTTDLISQDTSTPEITSFSVTPQVVDITNGPGQITITIGVTDDLSGVSNIFPHYNFPNGNSGNGGASLISGTNLDGIWERTYTIPEFTQTGTGWISPLNVYDNVGNQLSLGLQDLIDLGFDPDFEIIDNNSSDLNPPEITSFSVTPQVVDITDGPGQITITIGVMDDLSGVSNIFPHYNLPNGNSGNGGASLISGTNLDGIWERTYTIPQFTQPGTGWISPLNVYDNVGNQLSLGLQDLIDLGFDPDFEIIDNNTLPVVYYQPLRIENGNELTWILSQQVNNSHFVIEHSSNGKIFHYVDKIEGEANTFMKKQYKYIHNNQSVGDNYYRIKQVDYDGQYSYSNVVFVNYKLSKINVYPNPVFNDLVVDSQIENTLKIFNEIGQEIGTFNVYMGRTRIDLSTIRNGIYILIFSDGTIKRIIKTK